MPNTHRITASVLRLREGPSTDHAIIERLPFNTPLEVLPGPRADWAKVRARASDGTVEGWVSTAHIEPLQQEPSWMPIARGEIGVAEIAGARHHRRILEYHAETSLRASDDETAWCSAFVSWCMKQAGKPGTRRANARSWLQWGTRLAEPRLGCVVIFRRGNNPAQGHVAFYLEQRGAGILVLGGNQSNSVRVSTYPAADVLGYRWMD